ncbi:transposase [Desulfogranum mediterraneum]|uniref:transposase n=1 Tax=Desulfogranum mediterraneum TaxID=160661 RepID=UPI00048C86B6|nr:transposase [Desulfogranum mediterraneum]
MARAHRHYIAGHAWHITHRCHKREFLLKFSRDRHRWMQWLFEAKRRYGLVILNYAVTSNHVHLIVYDEDGGETIPNSIRLIAGRTGQEYNQRKKRKGAFWEDRYHATAIETGEHLLRCLVYVDLNMVRAGVVTHPEQWNHGGYNEIQHPRRKNILIDYESLSSLSGFEDIESFQSAHRQWVASALLEGEAQREGYWTQSIATGSRSFVEAVKAQMRSFATGRQIREKADCYELRESPSLYIASFGTEKDNIDVENLLFWNE